VAGERLCAAPSVDVVIEVRQGPLLLIARAPVSSLVRSSSASPVGAAAAEQRATACALRAHSRLVRLRRRRARVAKQWACLRAAMATASAARRALADVRQREAEEAARRVAAANVVRDDRQADRQTAAAAG
jgi:hypothetical protein